MTKMRCSNLNSAPVVQKISVLYHFSLSSHAMTCAKLRLQLDISAILLKPLLDCKSLKQKQPTKKLLNII